METNLQRVKLCVRLILKQFDFENKNLAERWLNELKNLIRSNDDLCPKFVLLILKHLRQNNCDYRLGVMILSDYFFQRSHKYRLGIVENIEEIGKYALEIDPIHYPLPMPLEAAKNLKAESLKIVRKWIEKFGPGYPKLKFADVCLNSSKNFDFEAANEQTLAERQHREEENLKQRAKANILMEKIGHNLQEDSEDIERCLIECRNALELIIPKFGTSENLHVEQLISTNGDHQSATSSTPKDKLVNVYSPKEVITIKILSKNLVIAKTTDNLDLINSLKDSKVMIELYLAKINKWIKKLSTFGITLPNLEELLQKIISIKQKLNVELKRCEEIVFEEGDFNFNEWENKLKLAKKSLNRDSESDESDTEFVDVLFEDEKSKKNMKQKVLRKYHNEDSQQPGPSGLNEKTKKNENPLKTIAPKLDYGLDLKYWGEKIEPAEIPRNEIEGYWSARDQEQGPSTLSSEVYTTRLITFVGEMPEITKSCRVPLKNGKLCPRMDRFKCPLHGWIIDRDEQGYPKEEIAGAPSISAQIKQMEKDTERDEDEYLRDVEAATGANLRNAAVKSRRIIAKKREKSEKEKSRDRLKEKLFDKRTIRRVSKALTDMQKARAERKFAHQFNYSVTRR